MSLSERIAYLICPSLKDEIEALRDGNTKVVLENSRLLDQIPRCAYFRGGYCSTMPLQDRGQS